MTGTSEKKIYELFVSRPVRIVTELNRELLAVFNISLGRILTR